MQLYSFCLLALESLFLTQLGYTGSLRRTQVSQRASKFFHCGCSVLCFNGLSIHKMAETRSQVYSASQIVHLHLLLPHAMELKWNGSRNMILLYSAQMALSPLCTCVALEDVFLFPCREAAVPFPEAVR